MKRLEKIFLLLSIASAMLTLCLAPFSYTSKMISSSSVLFGIAGLLQLELTGFFDKVFRDLSDAADAGVYPSHIYRNIITNPGQPLRTFIKDLIYYNRKCGYSFLLIGSVIQIISIWI